MQDNIATAVLGTAVLTMLCWHLLTGSVTGPLVALAAVSVVLSLRSRGRKDGRGR